jgi:hypothetical protein
MHECQRILNKGSVFEVTAAENGAESDGSDPELVIEQQVQQHEEETEQQDTAADVGAGAQKLGVEEADGGASEQAIRGRR